MHARCVSSSIHPKHLTLECCLICIFPYFIFNFLNVFILYLVGKNIETMACSFINKINNKLKFLYRKNRFLTPTLRWLPCNALTQPHFDYACSSSYPNLTKKLKKRIQTSQNKCIRFCLQLDKMTHISHKVFETPNWLPVTERFNQCIKIALENNIETRGSFLKLKCLFHKTNTGQMALSYIGSTIWSKTPDTLKRTKNLNTFEHNLKEQYLKELKNSNSR